MDWSQVFVIIGTNLGVVITLFLHSDNKMERHQNASEKRIIEHRKETNEILKGIQQEMKDFHDRLYALEVKTKKDIFSS